MAHPARTETVTAPLRLSFGERWAREATWLESTDVALRVESVDLDVLRAPVDVVIGRRNITERVPAEPLLPFLRRWCDAWVQLATGGVRKAIVRFEESPWEFALVRREARVETTLYRLQRPMRVPIEAEPIALEDMRHATVAAIRDAASRCDRDRPISARLEARLAAAAARLDAVAVDRAKPWAAPLGDLLRVDTRASSGDALQSTIDVDHPSLRAFDAADAFDRHALLAPGRVCIRDEDGEELALPGRPLEALDHLVDALAGLDAVGTLDRAIDVAEGVHLRVDARARSATLRVGSRALRFGLDAFWSLIGEHVDEVVGVLGRAAPHTLDSALLGELQHAATSVRRRLVRAPAQGARTASPRRATGSAATPSEASDARTLHFPPRSLRTLRHERAWTREVAERDVPTWRWCADGGWWGRADAALVRLDARTGVPLLEAPLSASDDAASALLHVEGEVLAAAGHRLQAFGAHGPTWGLDVEDAGRAHAAFELRGARLLAADEGVLRVDVGRRPELRWRWTSAEPIGTVRGFEAVCVVATRARRVLGLDAVDGRVAWAIDGDARLRLESARGFLFAWPREGSGELLAIEPSVGATVARWALPSSARRWDVGAHGAFWCVEREGRDVLVGFDAERAAFFELPAPEPVLRVEAHGALACMIGPSALWGITSAGVSWRHGGTWSRSARFAERRLARGMCVVRAEESVSSFEAWTGAQLGEVRAFWETAAHLQMGPNADGLLAERATREGGRAALHGVPAIGMLATLDGGKR